MLAPASPRATSTVEATDLRPLFDLIVDSLPGPLVDLEQPTQFQCNNLDYNDYVGRLAIGRVKHGALQAQRDLRALHARRRNSGR